MDLKLPDDVIGHIRSFLPIVSWRADYHFIKLLHRYRTLQFDDIPPNGRSTCIEYDTFYIYKQPTNEYTQQVFKTDGYGVLIMKLSYLTAYTKPLLQYLTQYREKMVCRAWDVKATFNLFGFEVSSKLSRPMYQHLLVLRSYKEGHSNELQLWKGCVPLEEYKKACTVDRLSTIEKLTTW